MGNQLVDQITTALGSDVFSLIKAIVILIVGWIVAAVGKSITRGILRRTSIDNRIASWIAGDRADRESLPIERWISDIVYWLILLFTVVAFLQALKLEAVSEPLNTLLNQVTGFLPQLGAALILLAVAWGIATIVRALVTTTLRTLRVDERLNQQTGGTGQQNQLQLTNTIGNTLYWFIFLLFLPTILSTLQLQGTLTPVRDLLDGILAVLPNVLAAVLIGAIGWIGAQIASRFVINLVAASGVDGIGQRFGLTGAAGRPSLSSMTGAVVQVSVLVPVAIYALGKLNIPAITEPATQMLTSIGVLIPRLIAASVVLVLAYAGGRYVADFVTNILTNVGFNNLLRWLELPGTGQAQGAGPGMAAPSSRGQTPSQLMGTISLVGIMLFATLAAVNILQIEALTELVSGIIVIAGRILTGLLVFVIGLYLANWAFNLIANTGLRQARTLGQTARIITIAFAVALALRQIGVATSIVNLAFGLLLGSIAVAIALAFGLGSRDIAAEQVREWVDALKRR